MILPREAVEAADDAYCRATGSRMAYALTAALPHLLAAKDAEIAALKAGMEITDQVKAMRWHFVAPFEDAKNEAALAELGSHGDVRTVYVNEGDWWMLKIKLHMLARAALEMSGGVKAQPTTEETKI